MKAYSGPLRPDYLWIRNGVREVALDAKFRLERQVLEEGTEDLPDASALRADIYKMHTYRDALDVRAAVIAYPGDESKFWDASRGPLENPKLRDLLLGDLSGVGALAMKSVGN